ncbi:MAG: hypothetical protein BZY82_00020 [SAR202 cluster bacterium Io17-Chloro-G3]|nr:MAG: hypothetical protein BZY82_00020 [SAR202 cluster bacterium Io17-Chloro-G3]
MSQADNVLTIDLPVTLLEDVERHAKNLAWAAGKLLLTHFSKHLAVEYKSKGNQDPVTEADRNTERLLIDEITARFPDHGILSEETLGITRSQGELLWVLDPLDGTTNFINGYPCFGVSIGVLHKGIPIVGALFVPTLKPSGGHVLHARLGGGAFLDDNPIRVFENPEPTSQGIVSVPSSFRQNYHMKRDLIKKAGNFRTTGSIAYEMALVASGVLQYAIFGRPKIWDVAAGILIIKESGGEILLRSSKHNHWKKFRSFLDPEGGLPKDGDLRNWGMGLIVGNYSLVKYVSSNLRMRVKPFSWLRNIMLHSVSRAKATELDAQDQARGTPAAQEAYPHDPEVR